MLDIAEIFEQAIGALRVSAYEMWKYLETLWNFLKPYLTPSYIENSAYEIWKHESPLLLIFIFLFIFLLILAAFTVFLNMAIDKEEGLEEVDGSEETIEDQLFFTKVQNYSRNFKLRSISFATILKSLLKKMGLKKLRKDGLIQSYNNSYGAIPV